MKCFGVIFCLLVVVCCAEHLLPQTLDEDGYYLRIANIWDRWRFNVDPALNSTIQSTRVNVTISNSSGHIIYKFQVKGQETDDFQENTLNVFNTVSGWIRVWFPPASLIYPFQPPAATYQVSIVASQYAFKRITGAADRAWILNLGTYSMSNDGYSRLTTLAICSHTPGAALRVSHSAEDPTHGLSPSVTIFNCAAGGFNSGTLGVDGQTETVEIDTPIQSVSDSILWPTGAIPNQNPTMATVTIYTGTVNKMVVLPPTQLFWGNSYSLFLFSNWGVGQGNMFESQVQTPIVAWNVYTGVGSNIRTAFNDTAESYVSVQSNTHFMVDLFNEVPGPIFYITANQLDNSRWILEQMFTLTEYRPVETPWIEPASVITYKLPKHWWEFTFGVEKIVAYYEPTLYQYNSARCSMDPVDCWDLVQNCDGETPRITWNQDRGTMSFWDICAANSSSVTFGIAWHNKFRPCEDHLVHTTRWSKWDIEKIMLRSALQKTIERLDGLKEKIESIQVQLPPYTGEDCCAPDYTYIVALGPLSAFSEASAVFGQECMDPLCEKSKDFLSAIPTTPALSPCH